METPDYSLVLRTPVHEMSSKTGTPDPVPGGNITAFVKDSWQRSRVWLLGDDIGQFSIVGPIGELVNYYDNWLTYDVAEISGGIVTWNGYIVKSTLNWGLMPITLDLSQMYNWVKAVIGDTIGTYTLTAENIYSQEKYGKRCKYLLPGVDTNTEAAAERDAFLKAHAWPQETPSGGMGMGSQELARLDVTVAGYKHTINDIYADDVGLTPLSSIGTAVQNVIDNSLYINMQYNAGNSTKLYDDVELIQAGDMLEKMLHVSDGAGNLMRGYIDGYRDFRYYKITTNAPDYYIRNGKIYRSSGDGAEVSPRLLQPGIYRNFDLPLSGAHRDSFFADRRDVWVDGVFIDREGRVRFQPEDTSTTDYQTLFWSQA